ncbi:sulfate ABC transporter substrate-binding protein [candidate division TA06 bacterium SM1_40]|uniref:Sulfate ABC transporter substrate-binding protein n=2 Tax=Bacteria division TA06 TaxID=1156500 RepID=A0A0S8JMB6_UNCT6|nr:MAG: sulfate ABC transporter substrate-binding protein [candidate division TA06 bacterium SM23_40]KPL09917.1 MAG: sulfate ABC transporter substrate-binding protein [candidate division TA06 bacterium SM1_40]
MGCSRSDQAGTEPGRPLAVRAWHFPDIVHSAAIVGKAKGTFREALGPNVEINWTIFNAGPSAIEALFAGEVDIGYIGPNPAVNGYVKSKGEALRIVCGASSGGAGLVVRKEADIRTNADLHGKRIATPQLGNTQDVACRAWLRDQGFELTEKGGTVQVVPVRNPDQLSLFIKGEIDAAWTKEPWVARLIRQGNGELFLDEREIWPAGKFVTAHVIVRTQFLRDHPDLVEAWIRAHVDVTEWINDNPEEARTIINAGIAEITHKALPANVLEDALSRTTLTYDPVTSSLFKSAQWAYESGFLGSEEPDLSGIYDLATLNRVIAEKRLKPIE